MGGGVEMKGYKGFNSDLVCQGFRFEVGKTYEHAGAVKLCESGFHFCENPLDVFGYYPPAGSRFAEIEADGVTEEKEDDSKRVCKKITIVKELTLSEMTAARISQIDWRKAEQTASGYSGAATASGNESCAISLGLYGTARGAKGCWITLSEWKEIDGQWHRVSVKTMKVDGKRIKADTFYSLKNGKFIESQ